MLAGDRRGAQSGLVQQAGRQRAHGRHGIGLPGVMSISATSFRPLLSVNIFGATGDFWDNRAIGFF